MIPMLASLSMLTLVSLPAAPQVAAGLNTGGETGLYESVLFEKNIMVPMRDGVRSATDINRPARNGRPIDEKLPLLLSRTGYNKTSERFVEQAHYFPSS